MNENRSYTETEYFARMNELRAERTRLYQSGSADSKEWLALSEKYEAIGAMCNAGECKRRAFYYAGIFGV